MMDSECPSERYAGCMDWPPGRRRGLDQKACRRGTEDLAVVCVPGWRGPEVNCWCPHALYLIISL